jgi:hypothetical protein
MVIVLTALISLTSPGVHAQCGSSVSSCKNCHEVKGQHPVNTKGEWHTAHAFGDFCEFCHAGNVQATEKDAAHQGLVKPLDDVKASCQSCHPDDYMARAKKYAAALGVQVGTGGGGQGGSAPPSGGGSSSAPPAKPSKPSASAPSSKAAAAVAPPSGGEIIDYNQIYLQTREQEAHKGAMSKGDAILLTLIVLLALVFAGLVWHFERIPDRFAAWWQANMVLQPQAAGAGAMGGAVPLPGVPAEQGAPAPADVDWPAVLANRPELAEILTALASADPETLTAMTNLVRNRPLGLRVLKAVGHMNLDMLAAFEQLDAKEINLLLALRSVDRGG